MEEAKKAAAKRREEALERLAKEEAEELRRYEADLAKATKASLGTADAEPDAMDPGALHRLRWMPIYGQPLRSGSRANAPRAPLTRQAIQTPRYPGAIFSLTATSTSERYGGRCRMMGCSPRLLLLPRHPLHRRALREDSPATTGPGEC